MDLVSDWEWLYRQDLLKIHHGQLPFLGSQAHGRLATLQRVHTLLLPSPSGGKLLLRVKENAGENIKMIAEMGGG